MRQDWLLLLLVLACAPAHAASSRSECGASAPGGRPAISVVPLWGEVRYDNSRTSQEITAQMARTDASHGPSRPDLAARGLTATSFTFSLQLQLVAVPVGRGEGRCVWPKSATLKVGYLKFEVYIARQYAPGSCAYGAVLKHEMGHVAIDRAALRHHLAGLRRALERSLKGRFPLFTDSVKSAREVALDRVQADIERSLESLNDERRRDNARHDAPESYRSTQAACADW